MAQMSKRFHDEGGEIYVPARRMIITEKDEMKVIDIALAAALLMTSGTAMAQSANDLQCLLVSNAFAKNANGRQPAKGGRGIALFLSWAQSATKHAAQLKTLLDAQSKLITDKTAGDTMNKCVQAIETKVQLPANCRGTDPAGAAPATAAAAAARSRQDKSRFETLPSLL